MAVGKSEVVNVLIEPTIQSALQAAANPEMHRLANMLEVMVMVYSSGYPLPGVAAEAPPSATRPKAT